MERRGFIGMLGAAWAAISAKLLTSGNARIEGAEPPEVTSDKNPSARSPAECSGIEAAAIVQFSRWCSQKGLSFDVGRIDDRLSQLVGTSDSIRAMLSGEA